MTVMNSKRSVTVKHYYPRYKNVKTDEWSDAKRWPKALKPLLEENKQNLDGIINRTTEVGSTMNTMETFKTILSEQNVALQENRKEIEDVDLAVAISDLAYINATYEATLKAVSTMSKTSILDYM